MRRYRSASILSAAAAAAALVVTPGTRALGQDVSAAPILQMFEASWQTMERRAPDIFMAGYGAVWTPPPGRASGGQSVGYDVYDRFDLGSAADHTLYGTETGLKSTVSQMHRAGVNVYTDMVWNHNAFWDNDTTGFAQAGSYPGLAVSYGNDGSGDFHIKDWAGDYYGRTSGLIDIAHEKNHQYIRNPVPGFANNIPAGTPGGPFPRIANLPDENNRRFYPDLQGPSVTVNGVTYYRWSSDPAAGDPVAESATGYLMRHTRWMVEEIGVDGFRLDATKHLIQYQDEFGNNVANKDWVLEFFDEAVNAGTRTPLLDGSRKRVFSFGEYLDTNVALVQNSIRKDANANRDALDFAMHYALKNNLTGDGNVNDWRNIVNESQDRGDDGLANNGSQGVAFDRSHDDGGAALGNVANAYLLMRPGNAVLYMNAKEFGARDFPKDGNGDALGGFYGNTLTKLIDIRNTHGRDNYAERWLDKETLVFERQNSVIAGYNNRSDGGYDQRTVNTGFSPGVHLVELTGNATDTAIDIAQPINGTPGGDIFDTVVVQPNGQITMRIPRNQNPNGGVHNKGYVIYGLQSPKGTVSLSNVARTIAGETPTAATNGTARLTSIDVIKTSSFDFTLNTNAVILSDGWRDFDADGDNALLKVDGGVNVNGNGGVDFTSGDVVYGFEQFVTQRTPGFGSANGNGVYRQTIDTTQLDEGYHYLTARAFRHRADGGSAVFSDFRKVVYVDRFRPQAAFVELKPFGPDDVDVIVKSTDKTASGMHVFANLGANQFTDAQLTSMAAGGSNAAGVYDRDLFKYGIFDMKDGNQVFTVVTFEASYDPALGFAGGGVNVQRFVGVPFANGAGVGLGDLNFNNNYELGDVATFESLLGNNNTSYNPAGDLNADGLINESDNVLNVPWLVSKSAPAATINGATQTRLSRALATDGTLNIPSGTLNVSGTLVPATPLTFVNSFNIGAGKTITKTGGQALNISAPQSHGVGAVLAVAQGTANINTNGGANLTINTSGAGSATNFTVSQNLKAIGVGAGGAVTLTPSAGAGGGKSILVTALNMTGGLLDLTNNAVAVNYSGAADPYTTLLAEVIAARTEDGTWGGPHGITSSIAAASGGLTGVAIAPAGAVLGIGPTEQTLWAGQQVDGSTVLLKYTYAGDANLDGVIDGGDYGIIDNFVQVPGAGDYFNGDFNYDGVIDGGDYGIIDNNIQAQGAPIPSSASSSALATSVTPVPEPSACGFAILTAAAGATLRRRRRKRIPSFGAAHRLGLTESGSVPCQDESDNSSHLAPTANEVISCHA